MNLCQHGVQIGELCDECWGELNHSRHPRRQADIDMAEKMRQLEAENAALKERLRSLGYEI